MLFAVVLTVTSCNQEKKMAPAPSQSSASPSDTTPTTGYKDTLLTTTVSPEVVTKGLEADGYQLGISAFTWGYPLVRMETVMRDYVNVPNPKPKTSYRAVEQLYGIPVTYGICNSSSRF